MMPIIAPTLTLCLVCLPDARWAWSLPWTPKWCLCSLPGSCQPTCSPKLAIHHELIITQLLHHCHQTPPNLTYEVITVTQVHCHFEWSQNPRSQAPCCSTVQAGLKTHDQGWRLFLLCSVLLTLVLPGPNTLPSLLTVVLKVWSPGQHQHPLGTY